MAFPNIIKKGNSFHLFVRHVGTVFYHIYILATNCQGLINNLLLDLESRALYIYIYIYIYIYKKYV